MAETVPFIQLRAQPEVADSLDSMRAELVLSRWHGQDVAYLGYAKTVEEHIRMLSGRQWDVYSDLLGRFVDVLQYMSDDEKRVRQRPVMDYLGYWYMLTLSKATENPPVISFLPSTADRLDAMLAEVMDPVWKTVFDEGEMDARLMRATAWALVAGESYIMTRADFTGGAKRQLIAPAVLSLTTADGQVIERVADAVPYGKDGQPQAQLVEDPENPGEYGYDVTGEPYQDREGRIKYDALCPLEIRGQWGSHIPWTDKRWIVHRWFLTPNEITERWGIQCEADHYPDADESGPGYLERMLFGTGYFGAARADGIATSTDTTARQREGFVCGYTMWEKPDPKYTPEDEDENKPGGRLLVVTASKQVLWDSQRPYRTEAAGPIRRIPFLDIPGRPFGSTPLEKMVPMQKRLNRVEAQIAEHTNLCTNPVLLVHELAGIDDDEWIARPGMIIPHGYTGAGDPAKWLSPPPLSSDVWRHKADVRDQLFTIGAMQGNQSAPPTDSASGELVEQLRFNADRPLAPLTRALAIAMADVAEDTLAILPVIWTQERVLSYAGQDNVVRTMTVLPEMFDGRVRVKPSLDSAAAESREKKQSRLIQLYQLNAFGNLMDPQGQQQATAKLLEMLQFPDMDRAMRPGGVDRIMAEHNLGRLVRGESAAAIPVLEVYDLAVHLDVLEQYMKAPEYLTLDETAQHECMAYREHLQGAQVVQAVNQTKRQAGVATATGAIQAQAAGAMQSLAVQAGAVPPPDGAPGGPPGTSRENPTPGASSPGPHSPSSPPRPDSRAA